MKPSPSRRWLRPKKKEKPSKPEGRYIFDIGSKHYELDGRYVQDAESPSDDRLRWVANAAFEQDYPLADKLARQQPLPTRKKSAVLEIHPAR